MLLGEGSFEKHGVVKDQRSQCIGTYRYVREVSARKKDLEVESILKAGELPSVGHALLDIFTVPYCFSVFPLFPYQYVRYRSPVSHIQ